MAEDVQAKMVRSAAALISTHGLNRTSFTEVLSASGAPRGSIYHHFPQGKRQLVEGAVALTSEQVLDHLRGCRASTAAGVMEHFVSMWRPVVLASGGSSGCAVVGVAIDLPADDVLIDRVRQAFRCWIEVLAEQFNKVGVSSERSSALAVAALAAMEGSLILCRAEGSITPLEMVAQQLMELVPPGLDRLD